MNNKNNMINFKDTLLMPRTDFEMRGNLIIKEPILIKYWHDIKIYEQVLKKRENCPSFILHDGPPYANGNIHCGHMLNRFLKDFIIRCKSMQGYYTPFIFGWDTHGLPIENKVNQDKNNKKQDIIEFRKKCYEYALKQVDNQKKQIERLGILGNLNNYYLTLNKEYEVEQLKIFKFMALNNYIFKGLKPVFWSPSSKTALAESEVEYYDIETQTIYVAFKIKNDKNIINIPASFLIWTTTPWTIIANLAICLNKNFLYGLFETDLGNFIFLNDFKKILTKKINFKKIKIIKTFYGYELENIIAEHPIYKRDSIVILGNHVTKDFGTGCVHTAPGLGVDDYNVGIKYNLKPYCPINELGYLDETTGEFKNLFYEDVNKKIIEKLNLIGALIKTEKIKHSYPHDWRTKKPLIFRSTSQWFCSIESIKNNILTNIKNIEWYPNWGEKKMHNMIAERNDWCISRQRIWGVPIPIIYNEDKTPILDEKVFDHIINLVQENGSDIWYTSKVTDLLPKNYQNIHSPNNNFTKENDIMDVWFDSGSSWSIMKKNNFKYPIDLYLEGNDQYRGWFNSSLIISNIITNKNAFKACITHGFVINENLTKMSKSTESIDPIKIINKYGADVLRLWAASVDYHEDIVFSENIIKQISENYRKIRNTFRFLLGSLNNSNQKKKKDFFNPILQNIDKFEIIDEIILKKLEKTKNNVINYFNKYNFNQGINEIIYFIVVDISKFYLSITKDILYCEDKNNKRRIQVQNVIYKIIDILMRLLTPILPFTMEEINNNLPYHKENNAILYDFPTYTEQFVKNQQIINNEQKLEEIINKINKKLEEARQKNIIGSSQEAKVIITIDDNEMLKFLNKIGKNELLKIFIISDLEIYNGNEKIEIFHSLGKKCPRCWNYFDEKMMFEIEKDVKICKRCFNVLKN